MFYTFWNSYFNSKILFTYFFLILFNTFVNISKIQKYCKKTFVFLTFFLAFVASIIVPLIDPCSTPSPPHTLSFSLSISIATFRARVSNMQPARGSNAARKNKKKSEILSNLAYFLNLASNKKKKISMRPASHVEFETLI